MAKVIGFFTELASTIAKRGCVADVVVSPGPVVDAGLAER